MYKHARAILIISLILVGGLFLFNRDRLIKRYKKMTYVDPKSLQKGYWIFTSLMDAMKGDDKKSFEEIKKIIDEGANVNHVGTEMFFRNSVLGFALARREDDEAVKIVQLLIQEGANVNEFMYNRTANLGGMMPLLSYAVKYSSPTMVKLLIDAGADVNKRLKPGELTSSLTALELAHILERSDIVQMLITAGAETSKKDLQDLLSSQEIQDKKVKAIEDMNFIMYRKGIRGPFYSPLMDAIKDEKPFKKIKQIMDEGADVNEVYNDMSMVIWTPVLGFALARREDEETVKIIQLLIREGANVNERIYDGLQNLAGIMPLLSYAVKYSSPTIVQLLIDAGADVNKRLKSGKLINSLTALELAHILERSDIVQMLITAGAKTSEKDLQNLLSSKEIQEQKIKAIEDINFRMKRKGIVL